MKNMSYLDKIYANAKYYNLEAKIISDNTIRLRDKKYIYDDWIVIITPQKLILKHANKNKGKINKLCYHLQKEYPIEDWKHMLKYINKHNKRSISTKYNQHEKIDKILQKYKKNHAA